MPKNKSSTKADIRYLDGGQLCRLITEDAGGFIVAPLYELDDDPWNGDDGAGYGEGDPMRVSRVFTGSPAPAMDELYQEVRNRTETAERLLRHFEAGITRAKQKRDDLLAELEKLEPLKHVRDLTERPFTHIVIDDYGHTTVAEADAKVLDIDDGKYSAADTEYEVLRLVVERKKGRGPGVLAWRLGYGWKKFGDITPCYSAEDAHRCASEIIMGRLAEYPDGRWQRAVASAQELGVEVPEKIAKALREKRIEQAEEALKGAETVRSERMKALQEARRS